MSQSQASRILETPELTGETQPPSPPQSPSPSPPRSRSRSPRREPSRSPSRSRTPRPSRSRTRRLLQEDQARAEAQAAAPSPPADGFGAAAAEEPQGDARHVVREAIEELAEAGAKGAAKRRTATEDDWQEFLTAAFGFLSMLLVWALVTGKGWSKQQRTDFELTDEEAGAVAAPAARIAARSQVNARWGKHVLGASDYILLGLVLFDYTDRISPLIRERMQTLRTTGGGRGARRAERAPAPPPPPPVQEERNGSVVEEPAGPPAWHGVYPANLT